MRGGRFVSGFVGEQFALPEAVEALRAVRKSGAISNTVEIKVSACDPLNLAGILLPGPRLPAVPTNFLVFKDGVITRTVVGRQRDCTVAELSCSATVFPCLTTVGQFTNGWALSLRSVSNAVGPWSAIVAYPAWASEKNAGSR